MKISLRGQEYEVFTVSEIILLPLVGDTLRLEQDPDEQHSLEWAKNRSNHAALAQIIKMAIPSLPSELCSYEMRRYPDGSYAENYELRLKMDEIQQIIELLKDDDFGGKAITSATVTVTDEMREGLLESVQPEVTHTESTSLDNQRLGNWLYDKTLKRQIYKKYANSPEYWEEVEAIKESGGDVFPDSAEIEDHNSLLKPGQSMLLSAQDASHFIKLLAEQNHTVHLNVGSFGEVFPGCIYQGLIRPDGKVLLRRLPEVMPPDPQVDRGENEDPTQSWTSPTHEPMGFQRNKKGKVKTGKKLKQGGLGDGKTLLLSADNASHFLKTLAALHGMEVTDDEIEATIKRSLP